MFCQNNASQCLDDVDGKKEVILMFKHVDKIDSSIDSNQKSDKRRSIFLKDMSQKSKETFNPKYQALDSIKQSIKYLTFGD